MIVLLIPVTLFGQKKKHIKQCDQRKSYEYKVNKIQSKY